MIRLYIVRHAESVDNLQQRISGHADPPLSPLGERQAIAVSRRLAGIAPDALYSSDLVRAVKTVEPLAVLLGVSIRTTELLREAHMGHAQGLTREELEVRFPVETRRWREDPVRWRPPGGESIRSVIDRCRAFIELLKRECPAESVVAAAVHMGSLRGLICAALGLPDECHPRFYAANASVSLLEIGDRPRVMLLNDVCHLADV